MGGNHTKFQNKINVLFPSIVLKNTTSYTATPLHAPAPAFYPSLAPGPGPNPAPASIPYSSTTFAPDSPPAPAPAPAAVSFHNPSSLLRPLFCNHHSFC